MFSVESSNSSSPPLGPGNHPAASGESASPEEGAERMKLACQRCGVEFESVSTLQAHRIFYCPKRETQAVASAASETQPTSVIKIQPFAEARKMADASGPIAPPLSKTSLVNNNGMSVSSIRFG